MIADTAFCSKFTEILKVRWVLKSVKFNIAAC